MLQYELTELNTGLPVLFSPTMDTPRLSLAVAISGGIRSEAIPGTAKLASRLLMKGTATRSAEALARELDERAIDMREVTSTDCSILMAVFLPRELPAVLDILEDILLHSTFADFEKEATRLAGEIRSALDLPAERAQDLLTRTLFPTHPYGNTGSRVLERLPELKVEMVREWHFQGLNPRKMAVAMVGDFQPDAMLPRLDEALAGLLTPTTLPVAPPLQRITEDQEVREVRPEAQQAQVIRAWYAPPIGAPEQPATTVMNTILGGAGLSSRLFTELRDKQGLAYSVWSQYVPMMQTGEFVMGIGTSPENVERARQGFIEQFTRMQQEPISLEELENVKGRLRGSFVLAHETTSQRCLDLVINQVEGLGANFSARLLDEIEGVTVAAVQSAAQGITPPSVTAIVTPLA